MKTFATVTFRDGSLTYHTAVQHSLPSDQATSAIESAVKACRTYTAAQSASEFIRAGIGTGRMVATHWANYKETTDRYLVSNEGGPVEISHYTRNEAGKWDLVGTLETA
jgi:hypothetical protein